MVKVYLPSQVREASLLGFANFLGVNISTMGGFELPLGNHQDEELGRVARASVDQLQHTRG